MIRTLPDVQEDDESDSDAELEATTPEELEKKLDRILTKLKKQEENHQKMQEILQQREATQFEYSKSSHLQIYIERRRRVRSWMQAYHWLRKVQDRRSSATRSITRSSKKT